MTEAVQKWRSEEAHLSGDRAQPEEEESIYSVHDEAVSMNAACT